jgi:hypothetical protein
MVSLASLHAAFYQTMGIMTAPSHNNQLINAFLVLSKGIDSQCHLDRIPVTSSLLLASVVLY